MKHLLFLVISISFLTGDALQATERSIGIFVTPRWRGEFELAKRIEIAAKRLNWEATLLDPSVVEPQSLKDYDFVLTLIPGIPYFPACLNYLCIMDPMHWFSRMGDLKDEYKDFDGYLCTLTKKRYVKQLTPRLSWYPSAQYFPYNDHTPSKLMHVVSDWGHRNRLLRFRKFYKILDNQTGVLFYGGPSIQPLCPHRYQGALPFDGYTLIEKLQEAGISLIFHSNIHLEHGIPSGRIFESAAASTIIISDLNPFVIKHFGDAVLYIDQTQSASEMAASIRNHLDWIQDHPLEAMTLAKRAHEIFIDQYTLESQLLIIEEHHKRVHELERNSWQFGI